MGVLCRGLKRVPSYQEDPFNNGDAREKTISLGINVGHNLKLGIVPRAYLLMVCALRGFVHLSPPFWDQGRIINNFKNLLDGLGNRLLHVSMTRVKCFHLLRRWESKLVLLREPRLQYHSTKETRSYQLYSLVYWERRGIELPART